MLYKNRYLLLLLLFALFTGGFLYLPVHIENRVLPDLALKNGVQNFSCEIEDAGIFSTRLSRIHGSMDRNSADMGSILIEYSPESLLKRTINSISVCGLKINYELKGKKLIPVKPANRKTGASTPFRPPLLLKRLRVRDSTIIIREKDQKYYIPFELTASSEDMDSIEALISVFPAGQKISASAELNLPGMRGIFSIEGRGIFLGSLAPLISMIPDLRLGGYMDLKGRGEAILDPLKIPWFESTLKIRDLDASFRDLKIRQNNPFFLALTKLEEKPWHISSGPLKIFTPLPLELASMEGEASSAEGRIEFSGNYRIFGEPFEPADSLPVKLQDPLRIDGSFSGSVHMKGGVDLESSGHIVNDNAPGKCRVQIFAADIEARNLEYVISLDSDGRTGRVNAQVAARSAGINQKDLRADTGRISLEAESHFSRKKTSLSIHAGAEKISIISGGGRISLPVARLEADLDSSRDVLCRARLDIHNGNFSKEDISVRGMDLTLPLIYPPEGKGPSGEFKISSIAKGNRNLGSIRGVLGQTGRGVSFSGKYMSRLLQDMEASFEGIAAPSSPGGEMLRAGFRCSYKPPLPLEAGVFSPAAKGVFLDGAVSLEGSLSLKNRVLLCSARTSVKDASVSWPHKDLAVEGIDLELSVPDLLGPASKPAQSLNFKKASLGDLEITNGRILFSLEKEGGVLVERANFNWCNGLISSESLRFIPGIDNYDFVLYCNRIDLASVLEQLAIAHAEGSGRVSGRIPLTVDGKKIRINRGFLYSTPGSGGVLHLKGAEILTSGIPPGTAQHAQLDLAREALKDFEYKWARVEIETSGEDLMVSMKFDGKPANPLPFVYKKEFGGFMRVGSDSMGSKFQGIRLDTNFSLPLDRIIQHKNLLKIIQ